MQRVTLEQSAVLHEVGSIDQTIDLGHTITQIINIGTDNQSSRHVMVNDMFGETTVSPSFFN